ncbi:MAG: glycosyltransferase [Planctomycetes bacterium]|nr:glycosyltransferase [Planctomycetota bacterium]
MTSENQNPGEIYDAEYYEHHCGSVPYRRDVAVWQNHFSVAARNLVETFRPRKTLDVGCAMGFLVEHLRDLGVEAYGIDASEYAVSQVREDIRPYCRVGLATEPFGEQYDLITCIEIAEHLPEEHAAVLVKNLCDHAREIVFSSTAEDHAERTHVNVQPAEYWQELFAQNGFYPVLRDNPSYIARQALRFRRITRKLKVVVFSKEKAEWAVVRLRVLDPLRELERQGRLDLTFVSAFDQKLDVETLLEADLFVVQREFADRSVGAEVMKAARLLGKPVVFEIDDLLTNLPRHNPLWSYCTKITPDLLDAVARADFITASTQPLIEELHAQEPSVRDKAYVCRNVVNTSIWGGDFRERRRAAGEPFVVGWFGSPTHDGDLAIVKETIQYLARKHRGQVAFHFWGYLPKELAGLEGVRLVRGPQADVVKHARGVRGAHIDLAIAPLADHPFNHSKSDLKWLEYSICGIPGVYSDITPYSGSIVHGQTGLLVENTTAAWVEALELMIGDHELRAAIARSAYETVRANLCLDTGAMRWDDLYRSFVATGACERPERVGDEEVARAAALLFQVLARQQARNGLVSGAAESLEKALELDPECAAKVVETGAELASKAYLGAAEKVFAAAIRRAPELADGHLWLVRLYRAAGDSLKAEQALENAVLAHPADADIAREHVQHLRATGQEDQVSGRLAALVEAELKPEEAVATAEMMVQAGRADDALAVVRKARAAFPAVDFSPLLVALERAAAAGAGKRGEEAPRQGSGAPLKVAVYTADPISGHHVQTRLASPFKVLERAALAQARWSDGGAHADVDGWADLVVIHRAFAARRLAEPIVSRARAAGKPIVFEIDDLFFAGRERGAGSGAIAGREDVAWMVSEADVTTVPTSGLRDALAEIAPGAQERIVVLESMFDVELWPSTAKWRDCSGRTFHVGLIGGWCHPEFLADVVRALGPALQQGRGEVALTTWFPLGGQAVDLPASRSVAAASPFYLEYAKRMQTRPLDLALVPVSDDPVFTTLSDSVWLELAACRVPGLFSARDPFLGVVQGRTGLLLGDDPGAWAAAVEQLMACKEMRRDMALCASNIAFAERTIQQRAMDWFDVYAQAIAGRSEPALAGAT